MAEIALVSARKSKLELDARRGDKLAQLALVNANAPSRILSTMQIGITLIGILTGVFSSDKIADGMGSLLMNLGASPALSHSLALTVVVIIVTFISMLIGELVPKRIGLINPEGIAKATVRPLLFITNVFYPFTFILSKAGLFKKIPSLLRLNFPATQIKSSSFNKFLVFLSSLNLLSASTNLLYLLCSSTD